MPKRMEIQNRHKKQNDNEQTHQNKSRQGEKLSYTFSLKHLKMSQ
jgi:hypothetical protein